MGHPYRVSPARRFEGTLFWSATCRVCDRVFFTDKQFVHLISLKQARKFLWTHHVEVHGGSFLRPF